MKLTNYMGRVTVEQTRLTLVSFAAVFRLVTQGVLRDKLKKAAKETRLTQVDPILGDPGADSGGEGKSQRAEKYPRSLGFPSPPLSASGSPRMG